MEYLGQKVKIMDNKLENVLNEGVFTGIDGFGMARLIIDGKERSICEGRMREEKFQIGK